MGLLGTRSQQRREFNVTKNAGSLYNKGKTNVELTSIYLGIWPHYIGNPHTNERDLSAGVDRLPRACLTSLADLSLQLHTTSGVAEIYICNRKALDRLAASGTGRQLLGHLLADMDDLHADHATLLRNRRTVDFAAPINTAKSTSRNTK